jgi:NADPH:quinone reductase-like Zn-dependent oxidoreductase
VSIYHLECKRVSQNNQSTTTEDWPSQLAGLLATNSGKPAKIDAVIDSGGGEIMTQVNSILKQGGKVVVYGM